MNISLSRSKPSTEKTRREYRRVIPLFFLMPTIAILLVFQLAPAIYTGYLSLTRFRRGESTFVGFSNYSQLLQIPSFTESIYKTFVYAAFYISLTVLIGIILGLLLNRNLRFTRVYLIIIFLPWVLSDVVTGTMWRWLFQPTYGILQEQLFKLVDTPLYTDPIGAMSIVIGASVWQSIAFTTILTLSALQTIPRNIKESAAIDGANTYQSLFYITLPLIKTHLIVMILLVSIRAINAVGLIYATTGGGPGRTTQTLSVYLLSLTREQGEFGLGAAISIVMLIINLLLTMMYLTLLHYMNRNQKHG